MNPRAATNDLLPFQGSPFSLLGISPQPDLNILYKFGGLESHSPKRREWDSNPRALADKRFSRPPRYDHFDISPLYRVPLGQRQVVFYHSMTDMSIGFFIFFQLLPLFPKILHFPGSFQRPEDLPAWLSLYFHSCLLSKGSLYFHRPLPPLHRL